MDITFNLFDLISLATILIGLALTYGKVTHKLAMSDFRVTELENDILMQDKKLYMEIGKVEGKLKDIEEKIEKLIIAVSRLEAKQ